MFDVLSKHDRRNWALANGVFALIVVGLAGYGVVRVSQRHWNWQPTFHARAEFRAIGGLEIGAKVRVQGIDAGAVEAIEPPKTPGGPVTVVFRIDDRLKTLVRRRDRGDRHARGRRRESRRD